MSMISVRVPDELKQRMEEHPDVNWSQLVREKLTEALESREEKQLSQALLISEQLSDEVDLDEVRGQNAAERIREVRDRR